MIQRIQTIYLLISLIIWSLLFFTPVAGFSGGSGAASSLLFSGLKDSVSGKVVMDTLPMLVWLVVAILLLVVSVFLYGKRENQIRLVSFTAIWQLLAYLLIAVYLFKAKDFLHADFKITIWIALPAVAALFTWLARTGIKRDISLLKSQDRIR